MRRTIALSLVLIFGWLLTAPLFVPDAEAGLPACCRRNGKHHCMMQSMHPPGGKSAGFASVAEKCPCMPDCTGAVHAAKDMPEAGQQFYAEVVFHPAYARQTEAFFRVSLLRSHQKRGPPYPSTGSL